MRFSPQDEDTDGSLTTEELAEALQLYDTDVKVSKRVCCDAIYAKNLKMIVSPRQARDQHAENYIKKEAAVVLTEIGVELPVTQVVSQPSPALRCPALRALHPFQCQFV